MWRVWPVSRVFNNEAYASAEARRRLLEAPEELGYRLNLAARALASGRTRSIGVVTLGTALHGPASLLICVERAARDTVHALQAGNTPEGDPGGIAGAVDSLLQQGVDGARLPRSRQTSSTTPLSPSARRSTSEHGTSGCSSPPATTGPPHSEAAVPTVGLHAPLWHRTAGRPWKAGSTDGKSRRIRPVQTIFTLRRPAGRRGRQEVRRPCRSPPTATPPSAVDALDALDTEERTAGRTLPKALMPLP